MDLPAQFLHQLFANRQAQTNTLSSNKTWLLSPVDSPEYFE